MIRAEVDGSGLLVLAAGCSAFKVGVGLGVDGVTGLSDAGTSRLPAPLPAFFFFVMLYTQSGPFSNGVIFSPKIREATSILDSFTDRLPSQRED